MRFLVYIHCWIFMSFELFLYYINDLILVLSLPENAHAIQGTVEGFLLLVVGIRGYRRGASCIDGSHKNVVCCWVPLQRSLLCSSLERLKKDLRCTGAGLPSLGRAGLPYVVHRNDNRTMRIKASHIQDVSRKLNGFLLLQSVTLHSI